MASFSIKALATIALYLSTYVAAAPTDGLTKRAPKVLGLDFEVHQSSKNSTTIVKRSGTENGVLDNEQLFYITYIELGSNKQKIGVDIDTGSSDLWVPDVSLAGQGVAQFGTYDPSQSSSSQDTGNSFQIQYGDGSTTQGEFYTDEITFGSAVLQGFQFADATTATPGTGILGIGLESLEAPVMDGYGLEYTNFPIALKNAGYIDKAVYSLYLDSPSATTGSLLFGGYDSAKISGNLVTLPHSGEALRLDVTLNSINVNGQVIQSNAPMNLDSGTTWTYFSDSIYNAIVKKLGGSGSTYKSFPIVPCSASGTIEYVFNGITISVPVSDLLLQYGTNQCVVGVFGGGDNILGDSFLRYAYLVYNLEDSSVQMGQVKYTSDSNIVTL